MNPKKRTIRRQHAQRVDWFLVPALCTLFVVTFIGFGVAAVAPFPGLGIIFCAILALPGVAALDARLRRIAREERIERQEIRATEEAAATTITAAAIRMTHRAQTAATTITRCAAQSRALLRLRLHAAHLCTTARTLPAPAATRAARVGC